MTRRVQVKRTVAQLRQYTKLGVPVVERQEVVNLLRRELAKRDARVRKIIKRKEFLVKKLNTIRITGARRGYLLACYDIRVALSGRKGQR